MARRKANLAEVIQTDVVGTMPLKTLAKVLASKGRRGDTILAHITPKEAKKLKKAGGAGTINPETGLPEFGFFGSLYDATVGQVVGPKSITGQAVEAARGFTGAAADAINLTAGNAIDVARAITGGTAESIQKVASKTGQTIEAIASDPRKLAAVAILIAFPGAAAAVGEFLLPEALTAGMGATAAATTQAIVGQTVINAALNKGDVDAALKAALIQQGVPALTNSAATTQDRKSTRLNSSH